MTDCCIVARTFVHRHYCIGALTTDGQLIRLGESDDFPFWSAECPFKVGQVWAIRYRPSCSQNPPHVEDVVVTDYEYKREAPNLTQAIRSLCTVWRGGIQCLYDGALRGPVSSGNMYLPYIGIMPRNSVGFWEPNGALTFEETTNQYGKKRCAYRIDRYSVPFVGDSKLFQVVAAGTLTRTSLTRWLPRDAKPGYQKCWLQISHIYA